MRWIGCWIGLLLFNWASAQQRFLLPDVLVEASGVFYAAQDSIWWLNDSGDSPTLYLTNAKGQLQQQVHLPIQNIDWEELSHDDAGNIYIGDCGNNRSARKDLKIYIYNPRSGYLDSIQYHYPDQKVFAPPYPERNFDMEGFFWHNGTLHLFSKNKVQVGNYYTKHYTLPAQAGTHTATLRDSIYLKNRVVTAAAISPDKQRIALLTYDYKRIIGGIPKSATSIYIFDEFEGTDFLNGRMRKQGLAGWVIASQYECLDFVSDTRLLVASERTKLYKQKARWVKVRNE